MITSVDILESGTLKIHNGRFYFVEPSDQQTLDRLGYQDWLDNGNTPDPFVGPSALELWQRTMDSSDAKLPRWAEDLYDALPQASKDGSSPALQSKVAQKKLLRQSKPI